MTIVVALLSAALFGTGVALQQRQAALVPVEYAARPGLIVRVLRQRLWLLGFAAEICGFLLQIVALRRGSLVVVQPLLTVSLLFSIAIASTSSRQAVSGSEWIAIGAVGAGLAVFMAAAAPSERSTGLADREDWLVTALTVVGVVGTLLWYGLKHGGRRRALTLGLAAGLGDAFMAVLIKAFAHLTRSGFGKAFTTWVPYALCVSGIVAVLITQTAYQSGLPKVSLPVITVTEPLTSSAIGLGLFGEVLHADGLRGPLIICAIGTMAAGLVVLSRAAAESTGPAPPSSQPVASL